jgi:hypothetical protein
MTYNVAVNSSESLEIIDSEVIDSDVSAIDALRIFASDRGFRLEKDSWDFEQDGQYVMTESNGTQLTVTEA